MDEHRHDDGDRRDPEPEENQATGNTLIERRPIAFAIGFEAGLGVFAVVLALVFGLKPWLEIHFDLAALNLAVLGTLPLIAGLFWLARVRQPWALELDRIVRQFILPLFRNAPPGAIFIIAVLAGVCEELLFRGVIQAGLVGLVGPAGAVVLASLLFGLAHAVSKAYFWITFAMGLYLGLIYQYTGNLLVPMLIHFLYDWFALHYYLSRNKRG